MHIEFPFTVIFEQGEQYWIAYCVEIPEANGQGKTKEEAGKDLEEAIRFALQARQEDGLRGVPPEADREKLTFA